MTILPRESSKTRKVLLSFLGMFVFGIAVIALSMATAAVLNSWYPLPGPSIKIFEYLGYAGWSATLGMRGWDIQTWDGKTFPERLNSWLTRAFSAVGIFSFVLARELIPSI